MKIQKQLQTRTLALVAAVLSIIAVAGCKKKSGIEGESAAATNRAVTTRIKSVCYVEVNSNDIRNVGKYKLTDGTQLFDIAIIFGSNINYNTTTKKAYLYHNDKTSNVLTNKDTYIKPLQNKGIKVLLSILGNHQGAGFCNFTSKASAKEFAQELANAVSTYGLDGIDFDDEWAKYGTNGTTLPNDSSFVYLISSLRELMPTKIISFYYYGDAASRQSYNGVTVGSKIDYSWNAMYGTYSVPNVPGLGKDRLSAAAIDIQTTSATTAQSLATKTKNDGYGVCLFYNLTGTNANTYLSGVARKLYGKGTIYTP